MQTVYIDTAVVSFLVADRRQAPMAHQWHVWTEDCVANLRLPCFRVLNFRGSVTLKRQRAILRNERTVDWQPCSMLTVLRRTTGSR